MAISMRKASQHHLHKEPRHQFVQRCAVLSIVDLCRPRRIDGNLDERNKPSPFTQGTSSSVCSAQSRALFCRSMKAPLCSIFRRTTPKEKLEAQQDCQCLLRRYQKRETVSRLLEHSGQAFSRQRQTDHVELHLSRVRSGSITGNHPPVHVRCAEACAPTLGP